MNCILCKANLIKGNVNHVVDFNGHIIIIKGVPVNICKQCGEYFLENNVALKVEKIIEEAKKKIKQIDIMNHTLI